MGLERAGMKTVAFCEIDPECRCELARHWPGVPIYEDVRTLPVDTIRADVICGGFPCQDISVLGKRSGLAGQHSGLWSELARVIRAIRPRFIILENSPSLCVRGMGEILADLADAGYDAEWAGIPAAAIGANHLRAREWVLAYPTSLGDRLQEKTILPGWITPEFSSWWASEPEVCRVDDGIPNRVAHLRMLGNAVVPQISEFIGRAIMEVRA